MGDKLNPFDLDDLTSDLEESLKYRKNSDIIKVDNPTMKSSSDNIERPSSFGKGTAGQNYFRPITSSGNLSALDHVAESRRSSMVGEETMRSGTNNSKGFFNTINRKTDDFFESILGYITTPEFAAKERPKIEATWSVLGQGVGSFYDTRMWSVPGLLADMDVPLADELRDALYLGTYKDPAERTAWEAAAGGLGMGIGILKPIKQTGSLYGSTMMATGRVQRTVAGFAERRGLKTISKALEGGARRVLGDNRVAKSLLSNYKNKVTKSALAKTVSGLGDEALQGITKISSNAVSKTALKELTKAGGKGITKMQDDVASHLLKSGLIPNLTKSGAKDLATQLVSLSMKNSARNTLGVWQNFFGAMPGVGKNIMGQGMAAATNLFILGGMHDMGLSAFKSLAVLGVRGANAVAPDLVDYDEEWYKDPYLQEMHSHNIWGKNHSNFIGVMGNALKHGRNWAIMSPTHFIAGGKGKWLKDDAKGWWSGMRNLWSKSTKKMSDKEAIAYVKNLEKSMQAEGVTFADYMKTQVPGITNWTSAINGKTAKNIIKEAQWMAPKMVYKHFIPEIGADIVNSLPRMLMGNVLMNAPNIYEYAKGDYTDEMKSAALLRGELPREEKSFLSAAIDPKAYGNSVQEAVGNIVFAMSIAKHQQKMNIKKPNNGKWWEGGLLWKDSEIRTEPYSASAKKMDGFRKAMNWFELYDITPSAKDVLPNEIVRTSLETDSEWQPVHKILKEVVVEDHVIHTEAWAKGNKELSVAYIEHIKNLTGRDLNAKEQNKLDMALEIISMYGENGVLLGKEQLRLVSPEKAGEIVENLNNLSGQSKFSGDAKAYSKYMVEKLYSKAADNYSIPVQNFIKQVSDVFNVRATIDPKTGLLTMQKFDLGFLTRTNRSDGASNESVKELNPVVRAFNDKVQEGIDAGYIKVTGENISVDKLITSEQLTNQVVDIYKSTVKELNEHTYGKESDFFDKDILTDQTMGKAYKAIKDVEMVNNVLHMFRPSNSRGLNFHTISDESIDLVNREILRLRLDEDLPISISKGKAPSTTAKDDAVTFYNNLKEVYRKVRGSEKSTVPGGGTKARSIELSEILAAKQNMEEIMGDAFTNKDAIQNIKNGVNNEFFNRLGLEEFGGTDSRLALAHLIYPEMTARQLGDTSGPIQFAKLEKGGNVVLPESRKLFELIKQTTDYKDNDITKKRVDEAESFYTDLELTVKASGSTKFKFSSDPDIFQQLLKKHGGMGVSDMLHEAEFKARLGKIRDAKDAWMNAENLNTVGDLNIESIKERKVAIEEAQNDLNVKLSNQEYKNKKADLEKSERILTKLVQESRDLWEIIAEAQRTGDLTELIRMEHLDKSYSGFTRSLEKLLSIDITKEGNINTEYMQEIGKLTQQAQEIRRNKTGDIDVNSLKRFYEEELKNNSFNLPNFAEKMSVNITPAEFQQRYNISSSNLESSLNDITLKLNQTGRGEIIIGLDGKLRVNMGDTRVLTDGFNELFNTVLNSYTSKKRNYGDKGDTNQRSEANMVTDTYQIISSHLLRRKIKKLTYNKGELEISEVYTQWDPEKGISGIDTHLGMKGRGWYEFAQELTYIDPITKTEKRGMVYAEYVENLNTQLESGNLVIVDHNQQINFMQGKNMPPVLQGPMKGERYIKVDFGEGAEYAFNINEVVPRIQISFETGGPLRQRLETLLQVNESSVYKKRFDKIIKDMTKDNPDIETTKDNLQTIHNILNRADLIIEGSISNKDAKNVIKVRKLDTINRGKTLTDEQFTLAKHAYKFAQKDLGLSEFKEINTIYNKFGDKISDKRIKSISIDDSGGNMLVTNLMRESYDRDLKANRITKPEYDSMISYLDKRLEGVSATDSPTFLTRDNFLLQLSQLGWRPEWFKFNKNGDIVDIKIGGIKPKGAHVEVIDGKVTVSYNKTAFFYDPQLSKAMEKKGIDEITFKSGSKVNSEYNLNKKTGEYEKTEKYIKSKSAIKENIGNQITDYVNSHGKADIIEKKYDSYAIINASKEVKASVGANSGNHFSHDAGILEWMNTEAHFSQFKKSLLKIKSSPYASTDIMKQILRMDESLGDADFTNQSYEYMIANDGLMLSPWMGDVAIEKVFSYFYKGGKIATGSVENSSYNVMAPNLWTKFQNKRLPIRLGGTQRRYGDNVGNNFQLDQKVTRVGFTNNGNVSATGVNFVFEHEFRQPGGHKYKADVLIGYDAHEKPVVFVDGYEISSDGRARLLSRGVVDVDYENSSNRLAMDGKTKDNKILYDNAIKELERIETTLSKEYGDKKGSPNSYLDRATNRDVIQSLKDNRNVLNGNTYMVTVETRQPRNTMNDVVINTIPYDVLKSSINKRGNQSNQNLIDLAATQDADMDFDKSNSYMATPSKYIREAVKNSGVELSGDSYQFADHLIKDIQVSLNDGTFKNQEIATWLQDHKGSELLRGRFVKMHNIMSYFSNTFGEGKNILTFKDIDQRQINVRMKESSKYKTSADQISHWVKIFIDNYKKSPAHGRQMTEDLVGKLMLGDGYKDPINGDKRMYEGLFEMVDRNGVLIKDFIGTEYSDVRAVIMDKMIKPISSYLRFNRGELQEGVSSKSLTLKDIANGYMELKNNLNEGLTSWDTEKGLFKQLSFYKTPGFERHINIREGVKALELFISETSNSPFDRMMKNINEAYYESLHVKESSFNEFTDFIFKMENEYVHRLTNKMGVSKKDLMNFKLTEAENFQGQLYEHVKKDWDLAKVTLLKRKLSSLVDKKLWIENEPREQNQKSLSDLTERIIFLQEGINDLEIRLQGDIQRSNNWDVYTGYKNDVGTLRPKDLNRVIYDAYGNVKEVVKYQDTNKLPIIKSDVIVDNSRKFEAQNADQQAFLHARLMAFGSSEPTAGGAHSNKRDKSVVLRAESMWVEGQQILSDQLNKSKEGNSGAAIKKYVSDSKVLLHNVLNGLNESGLGTPLQRKMFLWKLLTPNLIQSTISSRRTHDGDHFFGPKYLDNFKADKIVTSYLLEVGKGTGFGKIGQTGNNNLLTRGEALRWLTEIGKRQHLSYIGIVNPELNVMLDPNPSGNAYFKNKNVSRGKISDSVYENPYVGNNVEKSDHALEVLNDFAHGGRMVTPHDLRRLHTMVERGVAINDIIEYNQGFDKSRKYGVWGKVNKSKTLTPKNRVIEELKRLKEACKTTGGI